MTTFRRVPETFSFYQVPEGGTDDVLAALAPMGAVEVYSAPDGGFRVLVGDTGLGPGLHTPQQGLIYSGQWLSTNPLEPGTPRQLTIVNDPAQYGFELAE